METYNNLKKLNSLFFSITGRSIDMTSFNDRMSLQKIIYILKDAGIDFNYSFSWYLRGPYSSTLASDGFEISKKVSSGIDLTAPLEKEDIIILSRMKEIFSTELKDVNKLELYASILYLKNEGKILFSDMVSSTKIIRSLKPWFTEQEIKNVIEKIGTSKLFD